MNIKDSAGFRKTSLALTVLILAALGCSIAPASSGLANNTQTSRLTPAGDDTPEPGEGLVEIPLKIGYGGRGPFYEIYFSDPFDAAAGRNEDGLDLRLVESIDAARISVDVAAYSISLYSVRKALIDAFNRGVPVRIVMESDNMTDTTPLALIAAGIPVVGDRRECLMHNKFIIIDRAEVWTGSMNYTTSGTYQDNNNIIRLRSAKIVKDYQLEFEEMFKDDFFGPDVIAETPFPKITMDGVNLEVYFSPDDRVARRIVALLRGAKTSINFMAYSFTANDFGDIVRQKAQDGLTVTGVMDESQIKSNTGTEFDVFSQVGLSVYPDGNQGLMHHKVIIIDREIVITGSYNFTASAERNNDENVLIFFDKQIASFYLEEFQRVYTRAPKTLGK